MAFGLFSGFFMANIFRRHSRLCPRHAAHRLSAVLNLFGAVVSGFAPLFGGMWKKTVGIERLLSYTALVYLLGALLLTAGIKLLFQRDYQRIH